MKKENFALLVMGTVGGMLFALGMCMALLPQWNAFHEGIAMGSAGIVVLLLMLIVRRRMLGKPAIQLTKKAVGTALLAIVGALTLGVGMCMCMVWNMMAGGIVVGIVGIVLLLALIPVCAGLK